MSIQEVIESIELQQSSTSPDRILDLNLDCIAFERISLEIKAKIGFIFKFRIIPKFRITNPK